MVLASFLVSCSAQYKASYQKIYTFEEEAGDWEAGFADLPAEYDTSFFALGHGWGDLPSGLKGRAIYISGNNHSDDLFMYFQLQLMGLRPNATYQMQFEIELASNTPEGLMGIGGSPGESVYIKAGAAGHEPELITDEIGWLRLNIDKGNQESEGENMIILGTLANPNLDPETTTGDTFALMTLGSVDKDFFVTSDKNGNIWLLVGCDSGFEGPTTVFFNLITITLTEVR